MMKGYLVLYWFVILILVNFFDYYISSIPTIISLRFYCLWAILVFLDLNSFNWNLLLYFNDYFQNRIEVVEGLLRSFCFFLDIILTIILNPWFLFVLYSFHLYRKFNISHKCCFKLLVYCIYHHFMKWIYAINFSFLTFSFHIRYFFLIIL